MTGTRQLCTFALGELFLGLEVTRVQEVLRWQEMTSVPLAPDVIRGLINLRGQIVTAIDLRRRFGLPDLPPDRKPLNVVVRNDDGPISLLVDDIGDVILVEDRWFEKPPETVRGLTRDLIRGTYKLKHRLLLELDIARVIDLTHRQEA